MVGGDDKRLEEYIDIWSRGYKMTVRGGPSYDRLEIRSRLASPTNRSSDKRVYEDRSSGGCAGSVRASLIRGVPDNSGAGGSTTLYYFLVY